MKKQILSLLLVALFVPKLLAQTTGDYRSNAAAFNWSTTASWQRWNGASWVSNPAEGYPGQNASPGTVTIQNGHTVTANTDVTTNDLGNLILLGSAILTFSNNVDIDVTGLLTMDGTSQITGTSTSRTLDVGALEIPVTATNARITNILFRVLINDTTPPIDPTQDGHATIAGSLNMSQTTSTINGPTDVTGTLTLSSDTGTKTFNGKVTVSGTWTSTAITTNGRLVFGSEVLTSGVFNCGCN